MSQWILTFLSSAKCNGTKCALNFISFSSQVHWILFHSLLKWRLRWRDQGFHPGLVAGEVALPILQGQPRPGLCLPLGWGFSNRLLDFQGIMSNFLLLYWMDFCSLIRSKSWSIVLWFTGIARVDCFLTWSPINVFSVVVSCRPFSASTRWISTWGG